MTGADAERALGPLPPDFVLQLEGEEELLVSSRDPGGEGRVRMWFAVAPSGHIYLLTPAISRKAERWLEDSWVRLRIPGSRVSQEGRVQLVDSKGALADVELLVERFRLSGAATPEALAWMLDSGSHLLLRAGLAKRP
ncbi:MAG: hypothetical protein ACYDEA_02715 [Candidatus Dormibacteria bacterium]